MHILILPSWYGTSDVPWSGAFIENQALALAAAGAHVGVVFVEQRSLRSFALSKLRQSHFQVTCSAERDVTTLRVKGWNTLGQTLAGARIWSALSERAVREYVRRFGVPDVLHAHAALWAGRVAIKVSRVLSRPSVVTEHSSLILMNALGSGERREAARVYREADAVLAVSKPLLRAISSIAKVQRAQVVPEAADLDFFTMPIIPRHSTPFTFLCVCNLVPGKRVDRLIRAFARVAQTGASVRLVVVGAGIESDALRLLAQQCGVAQLVEFTGGLSKHDVRSRMWMANALVLPSAFETFGVVLVEALATGIPVIATRCGGPEEIVDENLGLLVEPDNENQLTEAMVIMSTRRYSANVLRESVVSRFGFASIASQLLEVYSTLTYERTTTSAQIDAALSQISNHPNEGRGR